MIAKNVAALVLVFSLSVLATAATVNERAPRFLLPSWKGTEHSLNSYRGRVVFINFWASWCAPCQQELPELQRLSAEMKGKRVAVVAINIDRDRSEALALLKRLKIQRESLEVLWDSRSKIVETYNVETMPGSFIVDKKGTIRFVHTGFHDNDPAAWRREIASLLR